MSEEEREVIEWIRTRPKPVLRAIRDYPPGRYRLTTTGQIVLLGTYTQSGRADQTPETAPVEECSVFVLEGRVHVGWTVFGIALADLELLEADFPEKHRRLVLELLADG